MAQKSFDPQAFTFAAPVALAAGAEEAANRAFSGVAYGGGVITDHGWWDAVVFDLDSIKMQDRMPVLFEHEQSIGVVTKSEVNGRIAVEGNLFTAFDDLAKNVAAKADAGMSWQMSVRIMPQTVQQVGAKETVRVNGMDFQGPGVVFRNSRVREVSFAAVGADDSTSANVFAHSGNYSVEFTSMSEPNQELDAIKAERDALQASNTALKTQVDELTAKFEAARIAKRTDEVRALFTAVGMEFSDAAAKPFVDMGDEQFSATKEAMTKLKGGNANDRLFSQIDTSRKAKPDGFRAPPGFSVDESSLALHERAQAIAAERKIDYYAAVQAAEKE